MTAKHIAVIDVGKTNAKLALVDLATLYEIDVVTRPNAVIPGPPWPHFDVEGLWQFLLDALARFHARHRVDAISVTTHGAAIALIGQDGELAAPILDYEHPGPDEVAEAYDSIRPPFSETGSPRVGKGLNVGAQLYWQFHEMPDLAGRIRHVVTYPQYWSHRLTGVAATEVTSLGAHTDLWNPHERRLSSLAGRLRIENKIAPLRKAGEVLGPVRPEVAARTGLRPDTPVQSGLHDSNASLLPHLLTRTAPFSVVSTGTWVIVMAIGGKAVTLDPARDTIVNVNAFGDPVPSARFMGGREYDLLTGGEFCEPSENEIATVLRSSTMLLPAVVPETGPFQGMTALWTGSEPSRGSGERTACIGFYLALMTSRCLDLIGHDGSIHVEGPFARNACYLGMLASATGDEVIATGSATGTGQGAALLWRKPDDPLPATGTGAPPVLRSDPLTQYARTWRDRVERRTNRSPQAQ